MRHNHMAGEDTAVTRVRQAHCCGVEFQADNTDSLEGEMPLPVPQVATMAGVRLLRVYRVERRIAAAR